MRTQGWGWGGGESRCCSSSFHKHRQIVFQNVDYLFVLPPLVLRGFCFPMFAPTPTPTRPQHLVWSGVSKRRHLIAWARQGNWVRFSEPPFLLQSAPGHDSIQSRKHGRQEEGRLLRQTICFLLGKKIFPELPGILPFCLIGQLGPVCPPKPPSRDKRMAPFHGCCSLPRTRTERSVSTRGWREWRTITPLSVAVATPGL